MIDWSFMSGGNTKTEDQIKQFQQAGAQPVAQAAPSIGAISLIPANSITMQNSGALADALASGSSNPVADANANKDSWMNRFGGKSGASYILASIGQALSARDPNSWQHMLSSQVKAGASTQMEQRAKIIAALQQKMAGNNSIINTPSPNTAQVSSVFSTKVPKYDLTGLPVGIDSNTFNPLPQNVYSDILGQIK